MPSNLQHTPPPSVNPNELSDASSDPTISKIYVNGFTLGLTNADLLFVGKLNNKPEVVVNMSFTLAKTLVKQLNGLILSLESSTERDIMTTDVIDSVMGKMAAAKK